MQLFVRTLQNAATLTLDVGSESTITSVMEAVEARSGVPREQQRLFDGRRWLSPRNGRTLGQCGVVDGSTVQLLLRGGLSGGGGDGGSTANDRLLMEFRADISAPGTSWEKAVKANRSEVNAAQATGCAISSMELVEPVVCCELGQLYTKEALLKALVGKTLPEKAAHITGMSDVTEVKLTSREGAGDAAHADAGGGGIAYQGARFQCPVTFRDMNGTNKFCVIRTSGACVSTEAVRQIASGRTCPVTGAEFDPATDVITLYPDEAEKEVAEARMAERKSAAKSAKKVRFCSHFLRTFWSHFPSFLVLVGRFSHFGSQLSAENGATRPRRRRRRPQRRRPRRRAAVRWSRIWMSTR